MRRDQRTGARIVPVRLGHPLRACRHRRRFAGRSQVMSERQTQGGPSKPLRIANIGTVFTGDWVSPVHDDIDVIICRDGVIESMGSDTDEEMTTLDVAGSSLVPGLIDPHVHPVFGDFTPRLSTLGWMEAYVNGGITTFISAGEPHLPGRPTDPAGVKALAILAHKSFEKV